MDKAILSELCGILETVLALSQKTYRMAKAIDATANNTPLIREEYRQQFGKTDAEGQHEAVIESLAKLRESLDLPR